MMSCVVCVVGEKVSERQEVGSALSSALLTISLVSEGVAGRGVGYSRRVPATE